MKKLLFRVLGTLSVALTPLMLGSVAHAAVDTCIWTGGGSDNNFSTAANWSTCDNGTVPEAGDTLEFPANIADLAPVNNMAADTSFAAINFTGTATQNSAYSISGASIVLAGNITGTMVAGSFIVAQTFELPITLSANTTVTPQGSYDFSGTINLGSYTLTTTGTSGNSVVFNGIVSGTGNLVFNSFAALNGVNTFSGTVVSSSYLLAGVESLGTSAGSTTIGAGSGLFLCGGGSTDYTLAEPLVFTGAGYFTNYKIRADPLCNAGSGLDDAAADPFLILSGALTFNSDVVFRGITVDFRLTGPLSGSGYKILVDEGNDTVIEIAGSSNNTDTPNGTIKSALWSTTYSTNLPSTFVSLSFNNEAIIEAGGTVGDVSLLGGTLKGVGTVGEITMSAGSIAPGMSPGCLTSGNLVYTGGTVQIEINGATACTLYDQQIVNGTVDLGTATTLSIARLATYVPALNTVYTIINNDSTDAVSGTFTGLAQGATTVLDGVTYTISYTGGDGNDVTLTVTNVAASAGVPSTGFATLKASIVLPMLAILSSVALFGMQKFAFKKNK